MTPGISGEGRNDLESPCIQLLITVSIVTEEGGMILCLYHSYCMYIGVQSDYVNTGGGNDLGINSRAELIIICTHVYTAAVLWRRTNLVPCMQTHWMLHISTPKLLATF